MANRVLKPSVETGRVDFYTQKFKDKVIEKGYDITWERMALCPCRKDFSSQPISNCKNCNGMGYFWFDETQTIAMISNVAVQKKFLQWSDELAGSAYLTINPEYKVGWMDKITVTSAESMYSEICNVIIDEDDFALIKLRYPLLENEKMLLFVSPESDLVEIPINDIEYVDSKTIKILTAVNEGDNISILYKHHPTYLVIDTLNDYRNTYLKKRMPVETLKRMPIRVMIKKAHLVV